MRLNAPPSKAHTLRALFLGALAQGKTTLRSPLLADDQNIAIKALSSLGAKISLTQGAVSIQGTGGARVKSPKALYVGNSGVSCRFLTAIAPLLCKGSVTIDGDPAMRQRPLNQLLFALEPLGIMSDSETGCPPITLSCAKFNGGATAVAGNISSQYLSAILLAAPFAEKDVIISIEGELKSGPYVEITLEMMRAFGAKVEQTGSVYHVSAGTHYRAVSPFDIEGDYSNSSYFFAQAAVTHTRITVDRLAPDSLQGDKKILDILKLFGCIVKRDGSSVTVEGRPLNAVQVNMSDTPDLVPTVAVIAAFAKGTTEITGIGHLKYKETDRLKAITTELKKIGIKTYFEDETLWIEGGTPGAAAIDTYNDHRIAMAFSVAKRAVPEIIIQNPDCVKKSFPDFFDLWKNL